MPKLCINFEEILSRAGGNFKTLEPSIIIFNYCSIIIDAYYNYMINAQCNYYIANKDIEECDKEGNVAVTVAATASCLNRRM